MQNRIIEEEHALAYHVITSWEETRLQLQVRARTRLGGQDSNLRPSVFNDKALKSANHDGKLNISANTTDALPAELPPK